MAATYLFGGVSTYEEVWGHGNDLHLLLSSALDLDLLLASLYWLLQTLRAAFKWRDASGKLTTAASYLTHTAVFLAGSKRAVVSREWCAHLGGESGEGLPESRQLRDAAGFVRAAVRYRLQDVADLLWRPADAVLASRELSNLVVLLPTLYVSVLFVREGRLYGLADHLEDVAVVWGAVYALIRTGRWWRGVKPPERKQRRNSGS